jgi:hypothetical protein
MACLVEVLDVSDLVQRGLVGGPIPVHHLVRVLTATTTHTHHRANIGSATQTNSSLWICVSVPVSLFVQRCACPLCYFFQCVVSLRVKCVGEEDVVEDVDVAAAGLVRVDGHHVACATTTRGRSYVRAGLG